MEFDWDEGNLKKLTTRFSITELEDFFQQDLSVFPDYVHSKIEPRLIAVGLGPKHRFMFVCYTVRRDKIRLISARYMRKKEYLRYEKFKKEEL
ncbi:MAG: BrnT family toxin [Bacteriovoracaceae bacterium]|nr:BrnT family toxin [Bacteriovoracaceae bacterium]